MKKIYKTILFISISFLLVGCGKVKPTTISFTDNDLDIVVGDSSKIQVSILPEEAAECKLKWKSEDESVAIVDADGSVTGMGKGKTDIVAAYNDKLYAKCNVTVHQKIDSLLMSVDSLQMNIGESKELTYSVLPLDADDYQPKWESADDSIVSVDEKGNITANSEGKTYVVVSLTDDIYAKCEVTVNPPSAYQQLTKNEKVFVDAFMEVVYNFKRPGTVRITGLKNNTNVSYNVQIVAQNNLGVDVTCDCLLKDGEITDITDSMGRYVTYNQTLYDYDLITEAIQEQIK